MKTIKSLIAYLQDRKEYIVRDVDVVVEVYDPTYGLNTSTETISCIEFDSLLLEMDRFTEEFKATSANDNKEEA